MELFVKHDLDTNWEIIGVSNLHYERMSFR